MKKLIIALLFTSVGYAQEYGTFALTSGFQLQYKPIAVYGAEIEYGGGGYIRASVLFTTQNENSVDFVGAGGINIYADMFMDFRFYIGGRLGGTYREGMNAMAGLEAGFDAMLTDTMFIGVRGMLDYKSDNEFFNEPDKMEPTAVVRLGFKF